MKLICKKKAFEEETCKHQEGKVGKVGMGGCGRELEAVDAKTDRTWSFSVQLHEGY